MPPPNHGASFMNYLIVNNKEINKHFSINYIDTNTANTLNELRRIKLRRLVGILKCYILFIYKILLHKPNIIYFTISPSGIGFIKDLPFVLIAKLSNVRLLIHMHGRGVKSGSEKNKIMYRLYKWVFGSNHVIVLSNKLKSDVSTFTPDTHLYVLANGVKGVSRQHYEKVRISQYREQSTNSKVSILFLSNMKQEKGIFDLLEACNILKNSGYDFSCVYAGPWVWPAEEKLFNHAVKSLGLQETVKYIGPRYGNDKYIKMLNADILAFPSINEAFPLVVLEALSAGCPIVATQIGGISDIIENGYNGYLVPTKNALLLAEKLSSLIVDQQLRKSISRRARKCYEEHYTVEVFERNFCELLNSILASNN